MMALRIDKQKRLPKVEQTRVNHQVKSMDDGNYHALLATLTQGDVFFRKQEPWNPRLDLRVRERMPGWRPKGLTQPCGDLPSTNYSSALKQTIYEMMYVDPDLRPDLQSLKTRVQEGWRVAIKVSPHSEPWEDFVHPDPMESEWDPDA
jgi:hypothetical protein